MEELDPKYDKMVDEAFKNSPATSDPKHYLDKMTSFDGVADRPEP